MLSNGRRTISVDCLSFRSPLRENRAALLRRSSSIYSDQPTSYYFLTQCWIEPQDGIVDTTCPELAFLNGCTYKQIVDKVSSENLIVTRAYELSVYLPNGLIATVEILELRSKAAHYHLSCINRRHFQVDMMQLNTLTRVLIRTNL